MQFKFNLILFHRHLFSLTFKFFYVQLNVQKDVQSEIFQRDLNVHAYHLQY
jgi:hypothetical protein